MKKSKIRDMFKFIQKLIKLRKENSEFELVDNIWVVAEKDNDVIVFFKGNIGVVINKSENTVIEEFAQEN